MATKQKWAVASVLISDGEMMGMVVPYCADEKKPQLWGAYGPQGMLLPPARKTELLARKHLEKIIKKYS